MSNWRKAHLERHRMTTRQWRIANAEKLREQRQRRRKPRTDLACVQCGATFTPKAAHSQICSDKCREVRSKEREQNRPPRVIDREKTNKRLRRWRKANSEKVREQKRRARVKDPERTRERDRRWNAADPDRQRRYRERNRPKLRERDRRRYAADPEKARATRKRSYQNNIEQERAKARDRARWYAAHPEDLAAKRARERDREKKRRKRARNLKAYQKIDRRSREKNREKERERSRRNRAAKKAAIAGITIAGIE
jgi:hypothetical protein